MTIERHLSGVSIPIWCDWWYSTFYKIYQFSFQFQFLYGAIGGIPATMFFMDRVAFQFLYGAIGG